MFFRFDPTDVKTHRDKTLPENLAFFVDVVSNNNLASALKNCDDFEGIVNPPNGKGICIHLPDYGVKKVAHWGVSMPVIKDLFTAYIDELIAVQRGEKTAEEAKQDYEDNLPELLSKYNKYGVLKKVAKIEKGNVDLYYGLAIDDAIKEEDYSRAIFLEECRNFLPASDVGCLKELGVWEDLT